MIDIFNRIFGIQSQDSKKLLQLGPIFLLTGIAYVAGILSVQSIFVSRFGIKYLPMMYLIEAGILPLQLWLFNRLSRKMAKGRMIKVFYLLILSGLLVGALLVLAMYMLDFSWRMFYPLLFIVFNVLLRILVPLMWMLGDGVCLLQQAKRIYPILGVLFTLGATLAGLLASLFAAYFRGFGTEMLILLSPMVLFFSLFLWYRLINSYYLSVDLEEENDREAPMALIIKTVWSSSFLRITLIGFIMLLSLFYILDYQFFMFMAAKYPSSDAMTQYFGVFTAVLSILSIVVGLCLNRLINTAGVSNIVLLMGVTVFIVFLVTGFMAQGSWALEAFFIADILLDILAFTLLPLINQVLFKLLPIEQRSGASLLFAGSINAGGKLISAGITGLHSSGMISLLMLSMLSFVFACIYFSISRKQKHRYFPSLLGSLQRHAVRAPELDQFPLGKLLDKGDTRPILEALQSRNTVKELVALELCAHLKNEMLFPALQPFLSHPDVRKRRLAFQAIADNKHDSAQILQLGLQDPDPEIRCETLRLLKFNLQKEPLYTELLPKMLHDPHPQVIRETILVLQGISDANLHKQMERQLQTMLAGDEENRYQACLAIQGIRAKQYGAQVMDMLAAEISSRVRSSAVTCLGELGHVEAIPLLLGLYPHADRELRFRIEASLIRMGAAAVPKLRQNLDNNDMEIWYLCTAVLSSRDQEPEWVMRLNTSCIRRLKSFNRISRIPSILEKEGLDDVADLYRLRVAESFKCMQTACWKTLAMTTDPLIISKLKEALKDRTDMEKHERALEILAELSTKNTLTAEMLKTLYTDAKVPLEQEMTCIQSLKNAISAFPDQWLNQFSRYAIIRLQKGGSVNG